MRMGRRGVMLAFASCWLVGTATGGASPAGVAVGAAQPPDLATLRARAAASPGDTHAACELAFALVGASQPQEAVTVASPAIASLRAQTGAAAQRSLGACLYNRGRAHEALGARSAAVIDYADSLDLRPNETVAARLRALVPDVPADAPLAAVTTTLEHFTLGAESTVTRARTADHRAWLLVTSARGENPEVAVVARPCGEPRAALVDEGWFDNYGTLSIDRAAPRRLGALDALVVEIGGAGDATCGGMDGAMEAEHASTAILSVAACEVRVQTFVTQAFVCDDRHDDGPHDDGFRLRLDAAGRAVTSRMRGRRADDAEIGSFPIEGAAP